MARNLTGAEVEALRDLPARDSDIYGADAIGAEDPLAAPAVRACLARRCDIWVFGYGSLMWNPGFRHCAAEPALLHGWHRSFCVYSRRYRGTPERPGLVLGLDRGGSCKGIAFRIAVGDLEEALGHLWEREMVGGVYDMRELPVRLPDGRSVPAHAFTVRRGHEGYAGRLSIDETARHILQGIGGRGHCREYLENTVRHLERLGLMDGPLHRLEERVKALAAQAPPCG
ncbi:MAG: gamma-glutamylcyclotransferase [Alphaproteobacteria bacterium]|nr:gamma-glutamylcyclotransferase [Alphaproteobacteria bacterium]